MRKFLNDNSALFRLLRTVLQGCVGVVVANLDVFISAVNIDPVWKPIIAALVMAILSPIMAELGKADEE
jgi:hypothetical protein